MLSKAFQPCPLPPDAEALRPQIRAFLDEHLRDYSNVDRAYSWMGFDAAFTRKLAERGWIGMTWPRRYGGSEASAFSRYVLVEELLAVGAPVLAHWTADRQSGPLILNVGTEAQKERFLPAICRGESFFCIGMSEPDSGSDLAATRTRGLRTDTGWLINGTKLWTTNAHHCHYMIALVRTTPGSEKQQGLSQIIIDLHAEGVTVSPIRDLAGESHFNEVVFQEVSVPHENLIGTEGNGWAQVMSELAFERSGPERYLSTIALLQEMLRCVGSAPDAQVQTAIGRIVAHIIVLRQMSLAIAGQLEQKHNPAIEAAYVKDLGTELEQSLPEIAHALIDLQPSLASHDYARVLSYITQVAPSFSLRGGTREILRGIIARGLGLR
ncbi:acyl-CoA dehydrogenase [Pseudomonas agarici]|uniref:Acyl-CoA dehydrogenase n=1 Tax=Pseudomonas agarici TaxID=46677 RepID=A0A0X1T6B1_PSEAA|nr:acyl-CoA dehydrogenase family protein [Pseudomonas agarici]AMB87583.1 acyl-CoA dehydrogenase [Pseudomonas agarici]NWB90016.1 acyl-CoA dehydrogenase family protein [Pseudomonas agarici]NWC08206.1 acyl-CoA dehydrogenase family protein [Pseudomonas agarici]SEK83971.1 Acyl-CoA dehydrogenase [Pseudomonas agarici]